MNNYRKYNIVDYITNLQKWMEEAKTASCCNEDVLDLNYKVISGITGFNDCSYDNFKSKFLNDDILNLMSILKRNILKNLNCKTNDAAVLYCQLKFCKEFLEECLREIQEEQEEFEEWYVLTNYEWSPFVKDSAISEPVRMFCIEHYKDGDIVNNELLINSDGFKVLRRDELLDLG